MCKLSNLSVDMGFYSIFPALSRCCILERGLKKNSQNISQLEATLRCK